jgi:hypothetical protein
MDHNKNKKLCLPVLCFLLSFSREPCTSYLPWLSFFTKSPEIDLIYVNVRSRTSHKVVNMALFRGARAVGKVVTAAVDNNIAAAGSALYHKNVSATWFISVKLNRGSQ